MFGSFGLLEPYVCSHKILDEDPQLKTGALWLGDYQAALDKVTLKMRGVKTIVSVVSGIDVNYDREPNFTHQIYWAKDSPDFNLSQYFEDSYNVIDKGIIKPIISKGMKNGSVLVHCAMGISRSATILIAYMMKKFGCTYPWAYNFVKKRRVIISPNFGFSRQLKEYERFLKRPPDYFIQNNLPSNSTLDSKFPINDVLYPKIVTQRRQGIFFIIIQRNQSVLEKANEKRGQLKIQAQNFSFDQQAINPEMSRKSPTNSSIANVDYYSKIYKVPKRQILPALNITKIGNDIQALVIYQMQIKTKPKILNENEENGIKQNT